MAGELLFFGPYQLTWGGSFLTWGAVAEVTPVWTTTFTPGISRGAVWVLATGPGASADTPGPVRELTAAYGAVLTWRVAGHAFAQFSIDGRHDEAAAIVERESDLWAYRDGVLMFRGRVVGATDDLANGHRCQFTAVDYRGMLSLAARVEPPVPTFAAVDQGQIPWELIEDWQALDGGDWGITEGVGGTSGVPRDETDITPGALVGEVIDRLAERDGGFEWEISELLELNRWHSARGADNGIVLDFGGAIVALSRGPAQFGNVAVATGATATVPAVAEHPDLGDDQRGRWTVVQGFPSVSVQDTLDDKATWMLDQASTVDAAWAATLQPRRWRGKSHVWIGDTVQLRVDSGRLAIADPYRVAELQASLGKDANETIRLGLVPVAGS